VVFLPALAIRFNTIALTESRIAVGTYIAPAGIDFVHAHGTGELKSQRQKFGAFEPS
jgi:hypothetical protein